MGLVIDIRTGDERWSFIQLIQHRSVKICMMHARRCLSLKSPCLLSSLLIFGFVQSISTAAELAVLSWIAGFAKWPQRPREHLLHPNVSCLSLLYKDYLVTPSHAPAPVLFQEIASPGEIQ